jgi:hypothetical protein
LLPTSEPHTHVERTTRERERGTEGMAVPMMVASPPPSVDTGAGVVPMFTTVDELPEKAFFPRDYIARYKRHINELIKRMEHLMDEVENFESEGQKSIEWHGLQLSTLSRETVWHNMSALQDCDSMIADIVELFRQKIRVQRDKPRVQIGQTLE